MKMTVTPLKYSFPFPEKSYSKQPPLARKLQSGILKYLLVLDSVYAPSDYTSPTAPSTFNVLMLGPWDYHFFCNRQATA